MQIGLFLLMVLLAMLFFDQEKKRSCFVFAFFKRFGVAGLTPFFLEQIVSALIYLIITQIYPVYFNIPVTLIYGVTLHPLGLIFKVLGEKGYRYGLEWIMTKLLAKVGYSSKRNKLMGGVND